MRILWDFRLFSYGYAQRGVGVYTKNLAEAIIQKKNNHSIYIWADKNSLPPFMKTWPVIWIPYKHSSWKKDLLIIPFLLIKYRISLIHYWIALGPIHSIGLGLFHPCKAVTTIYDLGVELWDSAPFARSKRNTLFWETQKWLIHQSSLALCISRATKNDLLKIIKSEKFPVKVIYCPLIKDNYIKIEKRKSYFITLGGSPHKNLKRVVMAFDRVTKKYPEFKLCILGALEKKHDLPDINPDFLFFDDMSRYSYHRQQAAGLIFCSLHEGLGLPVIEAMEYNCPLILSDIPSLREICADAAFYVNPEDISNIAEGIQSVIQNNIEAIHKSSKQKLYYLELCNDSGEKILEMYDSLNNRI
ncbi:MAG: glycosyltransferase family 1 protein [Chitinispirillia bacterium]|jgi:glycosyltransferase involved in cell wall biosynthesis